MTVCNLCIYNPPGSGDDKPCTMCPASTNTEVKVVPIDVLDKIRTELHATAEMHEDKNYYLREEWVDEIIDKYKESEE